VSTVPDAVVVGDTVRVVVRVAVALDFAVSILDCGDAAE